jgi:hypothetical protein
MTASFKSFYQNPHPLCPSPISFGHTELSAFDFAQDRPLPCQGRGREKGWGTPPVPRPFARRRRTQGKVWGRGPLSTPLGFRFVRRSKGRPWNLSPNSPLGEFREGIAPKVRTLLTLHIIGVSSKGFALAGGVLGPALSVVEGVSPSPPFSFPFLFWKGDPAGWFNCLLERSGIFKASFGTRPLEGQGGQKV